jgi:hypothetical protein
VTPPTVFGRPASSTLVRAKFRPCSPSGIAQPTMASSIAFGSRPGTCASAAWIDGDQQVVGTRVAEHAAPDLPIGARVAATM